MGKTVDLALKACRKRQSPKTGFVHLFHEEESQDTIPLFENVCFAFALLQQKQTEAVLEGKTLLEKLLPFQTQEGNFPTFLHEYPKCFDRLMGLKIAPLFVQIVKRFSLGLGDLKEKLLKSVDRILQFTEPLERPPLWEHRFRKLKGEDADFTPITQEEWFQWLLSEQLKEETPSLTIPFHSGLQLFLGGPETQEKGEPKPCPIEWALSESDGFQHRLLQDHPAVIRAAALFPVTQDPTPDFSTWIKENGIRFLWKGTTLHSLSIPKGKWVDEKLLFDLKDFVSPEKGDLIEVACFCDISPETEISIEENKGTVFFLGQTITIKTPTQKISLRFDLLQGSGEFCGAIFRANRPNQTACKGAFSFSAFDWKIALRTLRREGDCQIVATLNISQ
ncbi:MAG: hypothetical protein FJZ64_00715 [Chlamydiae bacterium]|nr:hypothetical protein [Chlamydiota bacterium]